MTGCSSLASDSGLWPAQDLVGAEHVEDQHRVVGHEGAARLGDDVGVGHAPGVAGLGHLADDVGGVLLQGVVDRGVEVGLAAVVVDAEAAPAVEIAHVGAQAVQLHEDAAGLAQRVLDRADVRDLRADVEVEELQAVEHALGLQALHRGHHLRRGEAELRPVAGGLHPLAGALRAEARPHADHGPDVELAARGQDGVELGHAVHGDDDLAPELLGEERRLDEGLVLVAVAEDEGLGVVVHGQGHQELGLAARLDAEVEGAPVLDQLLDHVALLVDLDRVDAAVAALVVVLGDGLLEGAAELLHAGAQDVGEADQEGKVEAAGAEVVDELLEVDGRRAGPAGGDLDVAGLVDAEEVLAPTVDVVKLDRVLDRPGPKLSLQLALPPPSRLQARTKHCSVRLPAVHEKRGAGPAPRSAVRRAA